MTMASQVLIEMSMHMGYWMTCFVSGLQPWREYECGHPRFGQAKPTQQQVGSLPLVHV